MFSPFGPICVDFRQRPWPDLGCADFNQFVETEKTPLVGALFCISSSWIAGWPRSMASTRPGTKRRNPSKWKNSKSSRRDLFDALDRFTLAEYAARILAAGDSREGERFRNAVGEAQELFAEKVSAFFPAASYASATLGAFREDLDEHDFELWLTTCKHRLLEETVEEAEARSGEILPPEDLVELLRDRIEPKARCDSEQVRVGHRQLPKVLRFHRKEGFQMAAAASQQPLWLFADIGYKLGLMPAQDERFTTLRLVPRIATGANFIRVSQSRVELVEPWDADGQAVIQTAAILPILEGRDLELETG